MSVNLLISNKTAEKLLELLSLDSIGFSDVIEAIIKQLGKQDVTNDNDLKKFISDKNNSFVDKVMNSNTEEKHED